MHCLLLGNGLNRLAMQGGWNELLTEVAQSIGVGEYVESLQSEPLPLL